MKSAHWKKNNNKRHEKLKEIRPTLVALSNKEAIPIMNMVVKNTNSKVIIKQKEEKTTGPIVLVVKMIVKNKNRKVIFKQKEENTNYTTGHPIAAIRESQ